MLVDGGVSVATWWYNRTTPCVSAFDVTMDVNEIKRVSNTYERCIAVSHRSMSLNNTIVPILNRRIS
jgi:hypothetical protein